MANHITLSVGRLIEVRLGPVRTTQDVDEWFDLFAVELAKVPANERAIVAADWRACTLLSHETSERAVKRLTQTNPRIERSAVLVAGDSAIGVLQLLRVLRESQHPDRRLFQEPAPCIAWLTEKLNAAESARVLEFLRPREAKHGS